MADHRPVLVTTERKSLPPLLIIDKTGVLGTALAEKLHGQFLIVLVTPTIVGELAARKNIIHIPYRKKIPLIPDNLYSHTFLFYNGERELLDMLPSFMKKANESAGRLFFVSSLFHSSQHLFRYLSHHAYHHLRIMLYGEIFDNDLQEENLLTYFIFQARTQGRIEVPNNGLGSLYPVHLEDVLSALIASAFAQVRTSRILLAFPRHQITELSAARIIQKLHPYLKVDYRKYKKQQPIYYIPPEGTYCFPDYALESRLHDIAFTSTIPHNNRVQIKRKVRHTTRGGRHPGLLIGIIVLYIFILPVLVAALFTVVGIGSLTLAIKEAEAAKLASAQRYISVAHFSFMSANTLAESLVQFDFIAPQPKQTFTQQLEVGEQLTEVGRDMLSAAETMELIAKGNAGQPKQEFLHALATTKNSLLTLQKLQAEQSLPPQIASKLASLDDVIMLLENTGDTLPVVLGFEGKKTYLVLFQNNMELRPGGGFIGSYGIVTVENGKTGKLQIHDVYDADGKLTTHIEPPYGLRRYLGAPHWFMRDSNFDPDFIKNAQVAANFLQLETKQKVDGVIAVDTTFLQQVLKAFGPVTVADYKETITADNFYLITQTHAEKDFFPGSTQKKDFLRTLTNAMLLHMQEQKPLSYPVLISGLMESLRGKHVMVAFSDSGVQEAFTVNNLSGALWDARSPAEGAFLDYLGVIDANIGTNKVNYYLKRSIAQNVRLADSGSLESTVTVTYNNTSKKESPFGGDYKNFVRFVLPKNAQVRLVAFDGQPVQTTSAITDPATFTAAGFIPPQALELQEAEAGEKKTVGFVHLVPAGATKTISLTYGYAQPIDSNKPAFLYQQRIFKQPGTIGDPYAISFTYPQRYKFLSGQGSRGVDVGGKVSYQTTLQEDVDLGFEFSKK